MNLANHQPASPKLLIVDDDQDFLRALKPAMERRGFVVNVADNADDALQISKEINPEFAIIDLKIKDKSGLVLLKQLQAFIPNAKMIVLTGFASIATAVEAIKLGATYYLAKPADADEIIQIFDEKKANHTTPALSIDSLEWGHIQNVLKNHSGNITATANALNMHRRTLQRKLKKPPIF